MKITKILWTQESWEDYLYWQQHDIKKLQKMKSLIKDIKRNPFKGLGKPEKLKFKINVWSRRINIEHRLVYQIKEDTLYIVACRFHYEK